MVTPTWLWGNTPARSLLYWFKMDAGASTLRSVAVLLAGSLRSVSYCCLCKRL